MNWQKVAVEEPMQTSNRALRTKAMVLHKIRRDARRPFPQCHGRKVRADDLLEDHDFRAVG